MKLNGIVMVNFRQYKKEVILFPEKGILGIVGSNGNGKSTILNAIGWAFYGKIKDVLKEHIKHRNAGSREECYVMLFFEYQGEQYILKRHLTKKDECFLKTVSGRPLVVSGRKELTDYITERFFKMDYTAFCACYYAQQDDFDALSKLTPAERRGTLTKLLRIDSIDKAVSEVKETIADHEKSMLLLEKELANEHQWHQRKAQAQEAIQDHQVAIAEHDKHVQAWNEAYRDLLVKRADGDTTYETYTRLKNEYKHHLQEVRLLEERVIKQDEDELARLLEAENRFTSIRDSIDEYNNLLEEREEMGRNRMHYQEKLNVMQQLRTIQSEVEAFKAEYQQIGASIAHQDDVKRRLGELAERKEALQQQVMDNEKTVQEKNLDIRSFKDKLTALKETKERFEQLGKDSPCPMCERPLGEHFDDTMSHIQTEQTPLVEAGRALQAERDALLAHVQRDKEEWQKLAQEEQQLSFEWQTIEKKKERQAFIQQQVDALSVKYKEWMAQYATLKEIAFDEEAYATIVRLAKETKPLHDEALRISQVLAHIPSLQTRIAESKEEAAKLKTILQGIEEEVRALQFDETAYKALTSQIESLQNDLHAAREQLNQHRYAIQTEENNIAISEQSLKQTEEAREKIVWHRNEMAFYLKMTEMYKGYKKEIIADLTPELSQIMSEDIGLVTDGYYDQVELDENFNIHLYRLGEKLPLSFYSGGEKKLLALLQLLGVSHLLSRRTGQASFDMVAMDEVLGSFDDQRTANTLDQLRQLNQVFPQILMVAHQEFVKDMFDYTLHVSTDDKRQSHAKWSQEWDDSELRALIEPYIA